MSVAVSSLNMLNLWLPSLMDTFESKTFICCLSISTLNLIERYWLLRKDKSSLTWSRGPYQRLSMSINYVDQEGKVGRKQFTFKFVPENFGYEWAQGESDWNTNLVRDFVEIIVKFAEIGCPTRCSKTQKSLFALAFVGNPPRNWRVGAFRIWENRRITSKEIRMDPGVGASAWWIDTYWNMISFFV